MNECTRISFKILYVKNIFRKISHIYYRKNLKGVFFMKHGKKPTREQKMMLKEAGLVPENWLVVKNMEDHIEVVSKKSLSNATKKPKTRKIMK